MKFHVDVEDPRKFKQTHKVLAEGKEAKFIQNPKTCEIVTDISELVTISSAHPDLSEEHSHLAEIIFTRENMTSHRRRDITIVNHVTKSKLMFEWNDDSPYAKYPDRYWFNKVLDKCNNLFDLDDVIQCLDVCRYKLARVIENLELSGKVIENED